jgi:protein-S-isoprenylcysteine O-methyltransferase Ste14
LGKKKPSASPHLISIPLLPFNVTVIIPTLLLLFLNYNVAWGTDLPFSLWVLFLGFSVLILGFVIVISAIHQFSQKGKGTLAPWQPPQKLVVSGVYRYTRNPMISGVVLVLLGEVIILGSWAILFWFILFTVVNYIYFIIGEEPELEKRFGQDYIEYKKNVPRLLPRRKPWSQKP